MILVKCMHYDKIDDEAEHCILLTTKLVRRIKTNHDREGDEEDTDWDAPRWFNNTEKLLPNGLRKEKQLGLIPYPGGTSPVVIADKHGVSGMWGQPLFLFFYLYRMQTDLSNCVGHVYVVEEVGAESNVDPLQPS